MATAIGILILVVATVLFHFLSPWWFSEIAAEWTAIDMTVDITFWVTGIVYIILNAFLVWVIVRYRHRKGLKAHYEPESKRLETWLTIVTSVGVIAMLAPGLWVWGKMIDVPEDAEIVEVVGQQWHWSYRFPGEDGTLGQVDVGLMSIDNPFGIKPDDPAGRDDVLVDHPELRVPVDTSLKLVLRSKDVLHNFTVPQFRVKMDLIPGMTPYTWLKTSRTGRFDILCEELCGIAHYAMRGSVVVEEQEDFDAWLAQQPTFGETLEWTNTDLARGKSLYAVCAACHGQEGEGNPALNAPKLAGQQSWYVYNQLVAFKNGWRGSETEDTYGQQMAGMISTLPDTAAMRAISAYIGALPDAGTEATISGDAERGRKLYTTCAYCHGADGSGNWGTKAPRLAGGSDWYLERQLKHYKDGVRGAHPEDLYGAQMALITISLRDEKDIRDVLAYLNTL